MKLDCIEKKLNESFGLLDDIHASIPQESKQLDEGLRNIIKTTLKEIDDLFERMVASVEIVSYFHYLEEWDKRIKGYTNKRIFCDIYTEMHVLNSGNGASYSGLTQGQQELSECLACLDEQLALVARPADKSDFNVAGFAEYAEKSNVEFMRAISNVEKRIAGKKGQAEDIMTKKLLQHAVNFFRAIVRRSRGLESISAEEGATCYFPAWFETQPGKSCLVSAKKISDILRKSLNVTFNGQYDSISEGANSEKEVVDLLIDTLMNSCIKDVESKNAIPKASFLERQRLVKRVFGLDAMNKVREVVFSDGVQSIAVASENRNAAMLVEHTEPSLAIKIIKNNQRKEFMLLLQPSVPSSAIPLPPNFAGFANGHIHFCYALEMSEPMYKEYIKIKRRITLTEDAHWNKDEAKRMREEEKSWWPCLSETPVIEGRTDIVTTKIQALTQEVKQKQYLGSGNGFKSLGRLFKQDSKSGIEAKQQKIDALKFGRKRGFKESNKSYVKKTWPLAFTGWRSETLAIWNTEQDRSKRIEQNLCSDTAKNCTI